MRTRIAWYMAALGAILGAIAAGQDGTTRDVVADALLGAAFGSSLGVLITAVGRPITRIECKVLELEPRSATKTVTLAGYVDGIPHTFVFPRACFTELPTSSDRFDLLLVATGAPALDVPAKREIADKPPPIPEVGSGSDWYPSDVGD